MTLRLGRRKHCIAMIHSRRTIKLGSFIVCRTVLGVLDKFSGLVALSASVDDTGEFGQELHGERHVFSGDESPLTSSIPRRFPATAAEFPADDDPKNKELFHTHSSSLPRGSKSYHPSLFVP